MGDARAHTSDVYEDDDGWIIARCACGWAFGAVPDNETAMDVLMDHASWAAEQPTGDDQ